MDEITYSVNCPRDFGKVRSVSIRLARQEDGTHLPSPCIGCDYANGSAMCNYCIDCLFKMSLKDTSMQSYSQPITPRTLPE